MNSPEVNSAPPTERIVIRRTIPLWRVRIYSLMMALLVGIKLFQLRDPFSPLMLLGALAAFIGWIYGRWDGQRSALPKAYADMMRIYDDATAAFERQFAEDKQRILNELDAVKRMLKQHNEEGEEWKKPRHPEDLE